MRRALIAWMILTMSATSVVADSPKGRDNDQRVAEAVQRAVSQVNKHYQGRVLSARPIKGGNGTRVRVKFLSKDGVIRTLVVDVEED